MSATRYRLTGDSQNAARHEDEDGKVSILATGCYVINEADHLAALATARREEREACAKVCDALDQQYWADYKHGDNRGDLHVQGMSVGAEECAFAIRQRSTSEPGEKA